MASRQNTVPLLLELHVVLPNQNIALHFWFTAKEPPGKLSESVCLCSEMNAVPGIHVSAGLKGRAETTEWAKKIDRPLGL